MEEQVAFLIAKCRTNDREAQFQLYNFYFNDLMRIARSYKNNKEDAAALVNEAFFKVFTSIDKYDANTPFKGWIKRIMINTVIDDFRKHKTMNETVVIKEDIDHHLDDAIYNLIEEKIDAEEITRLLGVLNDNERIIFNLFALEGYSHKEIVEMTGISERSSKRYLANAKAFLKKLILNKYMVFSL